VIYVKPRCRNTVHCTAMQINHSILKSASVHQCCFYLKCSISDILFRDIIIALVLPPPFIHNGSAFSYQLSARLLCLALRLLVFCCFVLVCFVVLCFALSVHRAQHLLLQDSLVICMGVNGSERIILVLRFVNYILTKHILPSNGETNVCKVKV